MKKGQIAEGIVVKVEFPNKGIVVTDEGERVIVKNTIPGQRVRFGVNKARKGSAEARLLETVERSPLETREACPHFGMCGGCTYQSIPYEEQLRLKEEQVRGLIESAVGDRYAYEFLGIKGSPMEQEYRNKMEFSFGDAYRDGPLALGMHRRGSFYDIVTVENCQIVDSDFRAILSATLSYFAGREIPYYHRMRHNGYLRHLLVRKAVRTGEILVDLVTTTQGWRQTGESECKTVSGDGACLGDGTDDHCGRPSGNEEGTAGIEEPESPAGAAGDVYTEKVLCPGTHRIDEKLEHNLLEGWVRELRSLPLKGTLKGILHTKNDSVADVVKNEGTDRLFGEDYFYEELLGLRFQISPFSFFQTNSLGAEVLYETVREFILADSPDMLRGQVVYDLYSGTGTIAQMLAPVCKEVVGVEIVEEAVEAAKANAALNGLGNCRFLAGDVLKLLDTIETRPDYIVLDPPRDGIHPRALEKIIAYGVEHLVYISCKPTSFVRDLAEFQKHGYQVGRVCCVDMFPGTVHVETIVGLHRQDM